MIETSTGLSRILGISARRVRQLVDEKIIERDAQTGKFNVSDCVQKYYEYKYANEYATKNADYERERALHERAKRKKAELQLAQMKGRLHDAGIIEKVMTDMLVTVKTKLRGIPVRIAPSLLAQDEIYVVENIVAQAIDECLLALSDYSPELFTDPDLIVLYGDEDAEDEDGEV